MRPESGATAADVFIATVKKCIDTSTYVGTSKELYTACRTICDERSIDEFLSHVLKSNRNELTLNLPYPQGIPYTIKQYDGQQFKLLLIYSMTKWGYYKNRQNNEQMHQAVAVLQETCQEEPKHLLYAMEALSELLGMLATRDGKLCKRIQHTCTLNWTSPFKESRKHLVNIINVCLTARGRNAALKMYEKCRLPLKWETPFKLVLAAQALKILANFQQNTIEMQSIIDVMIDTDYKHAATLYYKEAIAKTDYYTWCNEFYPPIRVLLSGDDCKQQKYTLFHYLMSETLNRFPAVSEVLLNDCVSFDSFSVVLVLLLLRRKKLIAIEVLVPMLVDLSTNPDTDVGVESFCVLCNVKPFSLLNFDLIKNFVLTVNFLPEFVDSLQRKVITALYNFATSSINDANCTARSRTDLLKHYDFLDWLLNFVLSVLHVQNAHRGALAINILGMVLQLYKKEKEEESKFYNNLIILPNYSNLNDPQIMNTLLHCMKFSYGSNVIVKKSSELFCKYCLCSIHHSVAGNIFAWCKEEINEFPCTMDTIHLIVCMSALLQYYETKENGFLPIVNELNAMLKKSYEFLKNSTDFAENGLHFSVRGCFAALDVIFTTDFAQRLCTYDFTDTMFSFVENFVKKFLNIVTIIFGKISNDPTTNDFDTTNQFVGIIKILNLPSHPNYLACKYAVEQSIQSASNLISTLYQTTLLKQPPYLLRVLTLHYEIIHLSNLKGLIENSANQIKDVCKTVLREQTPELCRIIDTFFMDILMSVNFTKDGLYMVRRNPESRVVLQSIVSADERNNKPFLKEAIEHLIKLLESNQVGNAVKTSTLHSLQPLLTNNNMQYATFTYLEKICILCLENFSTPEWKLKNSAIQVYASIVNRILGQGRNVDLQDLFHLYPKLARYFFEKLVNYGDAQECATAILMLLGESFYKSDFYQSQNDVTLSNSYYTSIVNIIKTSKGYVKFYAVQAYISFCKKSNLPRVIADLVYYLLSTCDHISSNLLASCLYILKHLYVTFRRVNQNVPIDKNVSVLVHNLLTVLHKCNNKRQIIFATLHVKTTSVNTLMRQLSAQQERLYFFNNIKIILATCSCEQFIDILHSYVYNVDSITLYEIIATALLKRYKEPNFHARIKQFLEILLLCFVRRRINCFFVDFVTSQLFFILAEANEANRNKLITSAVVDEYLNNNLNVRNIYHASIRCFLASPERTQSNLLQCYKQTLMGDDLDARYHAASTIVYLFRCHDKKVEILHIAFEFFLSPCVEESYEMCKFVSNVFVTDLRDRFTSCNKLLSEECLRQYMNGFEYAQFLCVCLNKLCSVDNKVPVQGTLFDKGVDCLYHNKDILQNILLTKLGNILLTLDKQDCLRLLNNF